MIPKKIQAAITAAALKEAFEPRFDSITRDAEQEVRRQLNERHPAFLALAADPDARRYLYISEDCYPRDADGRRLFRPDHHGSGLYPIRAAADRPAAVEFVVLVSVGLERRYLSTWEDLRCAHGALVAALAGVKSLAELPELARFAPTTQAPAALPAVPLADLRAQLARFGVGE